MLVNKKHRSISPYLLVILSFAIIIFLGAILLICPFSQSDGTWSSFSDAIFMATSSTCVTGLSVFSDGIGNHLTFFGQLVLLVMIQVGGLGFITIFAFILSLFYKKMSMKNRFFLAQAVNAKSINDMAGFVRKIILITFGFEFIGFLLLLPAFFAMYGTSNIFDVIWNSVFTSISAFCNAGFDLLGSSSLVNLDMPTWANYYLKTVVMILIILGGLSFLVHIEIFSFKKRITQFSTLTKIVLLMTAILLVVGWIGFILTDVINGNISVFDALFQSVTCRTAGFASFDQSNLSIAGRVLSCLLMYIGGAPLGTAGGIKVTTIFLIVLAMYKYLRGKPVVAFKRKYSNLMFIKATTLIIITLVLIIVSYLFVVSFEGLNLESDRGVLIYEIFSAFGTVGLSLGITPTLTLGSKIVLILLMFIGRLGPITMFQVFQKNMDKEEKLHYSYVEEDFLIG